MRILLADDHAIVRAGVRQILSDELAPVDIGEAAGEAELARLLAASPWDILVLDISFPGKSGLDLLKDVHATYPALPVLMLSMHPEEQYAVRALRAGASGYVTKDAAPAELAAAIRKVAAGGRYLSSTFAERLATTIARGDDGDVPAHQRLSDREYQVLVKLGAGKTVGAIAAELELSVKTVSTYRARLLEKLGMTTTAELTRYAIEHGLSE